MSYSDINFASSLPDSVTGPAENHLHSLLPIIGSEPWTNGGWIKYPILSDYYRSRYIQTTLIIEHQKETPFPNMHPSNQSSEYFQCHGSRYKDIITIVIRMSTGTSPKAYQIYFH